ncbi:MAG: hypothetical protein KJ999_21255 [Gammaproteobacteria bacterium]|nr:hypothetical protein [Gammaproteobacteria bacterium]
MTNAITPTTSPSVTTHRGAFRLTYTDIYPSPDVANLEKLMNPNDMVQAPPEFPVLDDFMCKAIIVSGTLDHLDVLNVDPMKSNVGLQGWVERYARNSGYSNMTLPTGFFALWAFRVKCLFRGVVAIK